jgi:hypothetical protein
MRIVKVVNIQKASEISPSSDPAYHGVPMFTGDLDINIRPDSGNAEKILKP